MKPLQPGTAAALRGTFRDRPWYVQGVRVVADTPDEVRLLLLPGAACAVPRELAENGHRPPSPNWRWDVSLGGAWELAPWRWKWTRILMFLRPGDSYAVYLFWARTEGRDDDPFLGWYENFQRPFVRTPLGFDTADLDLDIVVSPDGAWRWKDEDDYAHGVARGGISAEEAAAVEAAKPEVLQRIEAREGPFQPHWAAWQPPDWRPPELPEGWERV